MDLAIMNMERTTVKHPTLKPCTLSGWLLIFCVLAFPCNAADDVRLMLLDGKTLEGKLVSVTAEKLTLATTDGPKEFTATQIKALTKLSPDSSVTETKADAPIAIQLRDGSSLNANDLEMTGKVITVKFNELDQKIPAAEVQWIRLQATVSANEPTWQEIIASEPKSDRLVILRPGDTLDTVEGLVLGIDANEVRFSFDGDEIKAPRNKLLGMTFFSTAKKSYAPAKIKVTTVAQDTLAALAIESFRENDSDYIKVVTGADIAMKLPWSSIEQLDFSAGNLQLAAELSPIKASSNVPNQYPGDVALAQKLFLPHPEHYGRHSTENDLPKTDLLFQGSGTIEYRVPDGMNRFQATVAGTPSAQLRGWTTITVQQEDEVLFQQSFRPEAEQLPIDVAVVAKRRLTLKVQSENPRQADDTTWWLQPRFIK